MALLDLQKAYLQIWIHETLWSFQTVIVNERRHCLMRLGFSLNVAPLIMKVTVKTVLEQDELMKKQHQHMLMTYM